MARRYGRCRRDQRLRSAVPHGHWRTTTFIAVLQLTGIVALIALDGPINGRSFQTYVDRGLIPDLRLGDIVIMDNLGVHKGPGFQAAIEAAGATVRYLPPCSPDFNPIEKASSTECKNIFIASGYELD